MKTAITELISAARGQAERLRRASFTTDATDDMAKLLRQAEAKLWQQLADSAEQEAAGLIVPLPRDAGE